MNPHGASTKSLRGSAMGTRISRISRLGTALINDSRAALGALVVAVLLAAAMPAEAGDHFELGLRTWISTGQTDLNQVRSPGRFPSSAIRDGGESS